MSKITITVSGPMKSGKTQLAVRIKAALEAALLPDSQVAVTIDDDGTCPETLEKFSRPDWRIQTNVDAIYIRTEALKKPATTHPEKSSDLA